MVLFCLTAWNCKAYCSSDLAVPAEYRNLEVCLNNDAGVSVSGCLFTHVN